MALQGTKALEAWCKKVTEGYDGLNLFNMSTAWRNGLGFCAIIHHFRPELIDWDSLDPDDVLANNTLAFQAAEQHLGIPSLLDPKDMAECEILDRLSILTYLSQFYQAFQGQTSPSAQSNVKRSAVPALSAGGSGRSSVQSSPSKSSVSVLPGKRNDPCKICGKEVFILERLNIGGKLVHRTCFKCARCNHQLNIVNYYETEAGTYCCDVCPDEEVNQTEVVEANKRKMSEVALKDKSHSDDDAGGSSSSSSEDEGVQEDEDSSPEDQRQPIGDEENNNNNELEALADEIIKVEITNAEEDEDPECDKRSVEDVNANQVKDGKPELSATIIQEEEIESENLNNNNNIETEILDANSNQKEVESQDKLEEEVHAEDKELPQIVTTEESKESEDSLTQNPFDEENSSDVVEEREDLSSQNPFEESTSEIQVPDIKEPTVEKEKEEEGQTEDKELPQIQVIQEESTNTVDKDSEESSTQNPFDEEKAAEVAEESEVSKSQNPFGESPSEVQVPEIKEPSDVKENEEEVEYPDDLNPFGDEEEEDEDEVSKPLDKKSMNDFKNAQIKQEIIQKPTSTNPFGSDSEEEENVVTRSSNEAATGPPKPPRVVSLNPFGSDFEDSDGDDASSKRSVSPSPSTSSSLVQRKPKRRAPKPPGPSPLAAKTTPVPSPRTSLRQGGTPKRPPPPRPPQPSPSSASTTDANKMKKEANNRQRRSQILETSSVSSVSITASSSDFSTSTSGISSASGATTSTSGGGDVITPLSPDKASTEGQWKRKKGPAPSRPLPTKRQVKKLPRAAVNMELRDIEVQQQELERQGVKLEKHIRELCEKHDRERAEQGLDDVEGEAGRDSLGVEVEDLIIQLFDCVNEKNELFRRQTELMYMKRDHRLEEQHADIEHQIRLLMLKAEKTDEEKSKEEKLIARLMEIVASRNEIVDCMELDRLRELEEDESLETHLSDYAAVKPTKEEESYLKKKLKKKKKKEDSKGIAIIKTKKNKKGKKKDVDDDKDIDTSEPNVPSSATASPVKTKTLTSAASAALPDKEKAKKLKKKLLGSMANLKQATANLSASSKSPEPSAANRKSKTNSKDNQ